MKKIFKEVNTIKTLAISLQEIIISRNLHFKVVLYFFCISPIMPLVFKILSMSTSFLIIHPFLLASQIEDGPSKDIIVNFTTYIIDYIYQAISYTSAVTYIIFMSWTSINAYRFHKNSISEILKIYSEIIMIFTLIYFLLSLSSPQNDQIITGMGYSGNNISDWFENKTIYAKNFINSFYFSLTTMVTFNDGTMKPNWIISKIIIGTQLMLSFTITVIVIGRFFSENGTIDSSKKQ